MSGKWLKRWKFAIWRVFPPPMNGSFLQLSAVQRRRSRPSRSTWRVLQTAWLRPPYLRMPDKEEEEESQREAMNEGTTFTLARLRLRQADGWKETDSYLTLTLIYTSFSKLHFSLHSLLSNSCFCSSSQSVRSEVANLWAVIHYTKCICAINHGKIS